MSQGTPMSAVIQVLLFGGWGSNTCILLRFTSSSSLSLLCTRFSISSMFVGFGGSSGTGLYLSGCTTPVGESRKETPHPPQPPPCWFYYHLRTCPLPDSPVSSFATFPQTLGLPGAKSPGATLSNTLTANAFGVADFSTAEGIIVLLVAHQCVHAQNCWKEEAEGGHRMRRRDLFQATPATSF